MSLWSRLFHSSTADHYHKGIRYFNDGDYDRAIECLEQVVVEDKTRESPVAKLGAFYASEAHSKLGVAEFHRGNYDRALEHFASALKVNPHYPDLYYYLGVVQYKKNDLPTAIRHLEEATRLNPEYAEAVCFLGIARQEAGHPGEADRCYSRALELTRAAPHPLGRVLVDHLESNAFEHPALGELRRVAAENSVYEDSVKEGNLAFNQGDFARAAAHFSTAAALKPVYADLHCKLGMSLLEMTKEDQAIGSFRRALELNPGYVEAHYCLGAALYRLQRA